MGPFFFILTPPCASDVDRASTRLEPKSQTVLGQQASEETTSCVGMSLPMHAEPTKKHGIVGTADGAMAMKGVAHEKLLPKLDERFSLPHFI